MSLKHQKVYKQAGKRDYQQHLKDLCEDTMVSSTEVFTDNSPIYTMTSTPIKKPSAQKLLCIFTNILEVKKMLTVKLEMLNLSARQLNLEIHHAH